MACGSQTKWDYVGMYSSGISLLDLYGTLPSSSEPEGTAAASDFFIVPLSITSIPLSVSPDAILVFDSHPSDTTVAICFFHNSHGSHHTNTLQTMIHCNLIIRNQLVDAKNSSKIIVKCIHLTRPLVVTGLPLQNYCYFSIP